MADTSASGYGRRSKLSPEASADSDRDRTWGQQTDTYQGEAVLAAAVYAYRAALGSRLIAGYALGSLAHGGFSPLVSDVDLGLILQDPLTRRCGSADPLGVLVLPRASQLSPSSPATWSSTASVG